jgi:hypothetical protein
MITSRASDFAQRALVRFKRSGDVVGELYSTAVYLIDKWHAGDPLEMIPFIEQTLELAKRIEHKWHQWLMYQQKTEIYYSLGMYREFEASVWPSISLAHQMGKLKEAVENYILLVDYYITLKNYPQALKYSHLALTLRAVEAMQKDLYQTLRFAHQCSQVVTSPGSTCPICQAAGFCGTHGDKLPTVEIISINPIILSLVKKKSRNSWLRLIFRLPGMKVRQ